MNNLPQDVNDYNKREYWEKRFSQEDEYDWLCRYESYSHVLQPELHLGDRILILGCGNSVLSQNLYDAGFTNITNIDYSKNVIDKMELKCRSSHPEMKWLTMDIMDMKFDTEYFDIIIEKATLDSFMVSEKDPWRISMATQITMDKILSQVSFLLKPKGKFISITWAQPHFRKKLVAKPKYKWNIRTVTFGNGFHLFMYVMTKELPLSKSDLTLHLEDSKVDNDPAVLLEEECEDDTIFQLLNIDVS